MKKEIELTNGSLWKNILFYSLPLMFSNVLQVVFNMADVAVVGKFAGSIALGGVGSTSILITLFTGLLIGLANGVNALTALYTGSQKPQHVEQTVHTSVILCAIAGILISIFGIIFSQPILSLLNTKDVLMADALLYLRVYLLGMPALAIFNFGNAVLSAIGDTKRPLIYLSCAGVINIILNLFFVIVCHLGVMGVALASIISQYISACCIILYLARSKEVYALSFKKLRIYPDKAKAVLRIGIPASVQYAIFAVANLFVQTSVNSFDHTVVEGNSAAANADPFVYDMMAAFYTACASFIAQNYGAQKKSRIMKSYLISLLYSFLLGLILGVALYIFHTPFLYLFTNDAAVAQAGTKRLMVMALSYAVSAFMDCSIAASRGLGKTIFPTITVIMGSCVFRIVWIYTVFAHFRTIESLYLLYVFSWAITAVFEIIYFLWTYKKIRPAD